jgi:lipopolysaccharide export system protein LptA
MTLVERPVPIEGDAYKEIRLVDNVRAVLPNGVEFLSDVLTYSEGDLRTSAGVRLYVGGLVIESRGLRYDHQTQVGSLAQEHPEPRRPELPGPVRLWSDRDAARPATDTLDLQGHSNDILFDLKLAELTLRGSPELVLSEARLTAAEVTLGLDQSAGGVESIRSRGNARAVWLAATDPGEHVASGELIAVEMSDGLAQGLRVTSGPEEGALRPRFELGEAGELRADSFLLGFGEGAAVEALGEAYFFPADGDTRLDYILADSLTLGAGDLQELRADGGVVIVLAGETGEVSFRGPRAVFVYRDGDVASAEWPAGIQHQDDDGQEVTSGHGALDSETGDWLLDGDPRPRFRSQDFDVEADTVRLRAGGGIDVTGDVEAQLRGDLVRTVGPLFGGADQIEASAEQMYIGEDNRVVFTGNANIWQGEGQYLMRADEISVLAPSDELQATVNVFVTLLDEDDGSEEARTVLLTGSMLLVEGAPLGLVMAGEALLELEGEGRTIGGDRLEVAFDESGVWDSIQVFGNVVMADAAGTGKGDRLEYDAASGLVVIFAGDSTPATFVNEQGIDIRDREGLRLSYDGDNLSITAMQNGTTQTIRGSGNPQR